MTKKIKMKYFTILIFNIALVSITQGQTLTEKIVINACEYLDSIDNFQVLQDSIQPSLTAAMVKVMKEGTLEERKHIGTVEGVRGTLKESFEILPSYCYNVRRLIIEDKKSRFYKRSDNQQANVHFDKGNDFMESGDYKNAIKEFKSAVKSDNNFIYAIDHLAISYRRLENYKTAIKYYKQSLNIFPEGDVALLNIAVSYSYLEDNENSIKNYSQLKFLYPDNPEGYFGLAKMLFINGDYENALDNLFIAHRMYIESNSDYSKDSEQLMSLMFSKLKELNKIDLFDKKAKEHNITINK
jgi:tetratricopeptide (TPR) repeat protein